MEAKIQPLNLDGAGLKSQYDENNITMQCLQMLRILCGLDAAASASMACQWLPRETETEVVIAAIRSLIGNADLGIC